MLFRSIKEPTTDVQLAVNSMRNRILNERFYGAMIASSFDCPVHIQNAAETAKRSIKCLKCNPTDKPLFHRDIDIDMKTKNPCTKPKEQEITVTEVTYMGKKYYWNKGPDGFINLFEYKKSVGAYVPVRPGNVAYEPLIDYVSSSDGDGA